VSRGFTRFRVYPEDDVPIGDPLKLAHWCTRSNQNVCTRARRNCDVAAKDRRACTRSELFEVHRLASAMAEHGSTSSRPDIANPFLVGPKHGDHIPTAIVVDDDQRQRPRTTAAAPLHPAAERDEGLAFRSTTRRLGASPAPASATVTALDARAMTFARPRANIHRLALAPYPLAGLLTFSRSRSAGWIPAPTRPALTPTPTSHPADSFAGTRPEHP
jgi:hypothetical protein